MTNDVHYTDPLLKGVPDYGRELFKKFGNVANGFPADAVISASINVLADMLRQTYGKRDQVEQRIDQLMAILKNQTLAYYDPVTNRRRTTIPFTQRVSAALVVDEDKM